MYFQKKLFQLYFLLIFIIYHFKKYVLLTKSMSLKKSYFVHLYIIYYQLIKILDILILLSVQIFVYTWVKYMCIKDKFLSLSI